MGAMVVSDQNKLFVGGISWETTDDILKDHFGRYGTVISSVVAKDRISGVPRGFAFVTFSESSAVERTLQEVHKILDRRVEVKRAIPRSEQQGQQPQGFSRNSNRTHHYFRTKKIFVGGLSANVTEEEFRRYFEKFGKITDVVVMHDSTTHRPRGFGFITFDSEDSLEEVMQTNFHELSGKLVEVKRAVPKDGMSGTCNVNVCDGGAPNLYAYQQVGYPSYSQRFGYFPTTITGYPYGGSTYINGYSVGNYTGMSYGFAPIDPMHHWRNGALVVKGSFILSGTAAPFYPAYISGGVGVVACAANGYDGNFDARIDVKSGQMKVMHTQNQGVAATEGAGFPVSVTGKASMATGDKHNLES